MNTQDKNGIKPLPFFKVHNLSICFQSQNENNEVVKGIDFSLEKGKTLAIVGESGSGKSVTALSFTQLLPKSCQVKGKVLYQQKNLLTLSNKAIRHFRGREIAYIFQEPGACLNPTISVGAQIAEAIRLHQPKVRDIKKMVISFLDKVGIDMAEKRYSSYPHQFSGGMQQRIMIAMALACQPKILVADEPTTALDVTTQKQIMHLLKTIKQQMGMSVILITHNFGLVSNFADDVIVMFRGKIVESGPVKEVLNNPQHPYTKGLINCVPWIGRKVERLPSIDYSKLV